MNKMRRFLNDVGDEESDFHGVIKGSKKGIEMAQKEGKTYNSISSAFASTIKGEALHMAFILLIRQRVLDFHFCFLERRHLDNTRLIPYVKRTRLTLKSRYCQKEISTSGILDAPLIYKFESRRSVKPCSKILRPPERLFFLRPLC